MQFFIYFISSILKNAAKGIASLKRKFFTYWVMFFLCSSFFVAVYFQNCAPVEFKMVDQASTTVECTGKSISLNGQCVVSAS